MYNIEIHQITSSEERQAALQLAVRVFMEFEAPDYPEAGIVEFKRSMKDPQYIDVLTCYAAYSGQEMVGMIATRNAGSHIALFFVEREYQHQGIGRKLFDAVWSAHNGEYMTVNSSPFATNIYKALGFEATDTEQISNGIRFTPMKKYRMPETQYVPHDLTRVYMEKESKLKQRNAFIE